MTYAQPADEWDFLPTDEETPGENDVEARRVAEVAALHIEAATMKTPARDPAVADVAFDGDSAPGPRVFFADEQPEDATPDTRVRVDDHELDLEELLESQHYAFEPEPD
jgi:hypothetical protein